MIIGNYAWGRLSDWMGRRKPIWIGGLFGVALAFFGLSQAPTMEFAWGARVIGALAAAAYTTLSLAIITDVLASTEFRTQSNDEAGNKKGQQMGFYRGLGSLAFAVGATLGGFLADAVSLRAIFVACSVLYFAAAMCGLLLKESVSLGAEPVANSETDMTLSDERFNEGKRLPLLFLAGVLLWIMAHSASASMWPNYMRYLGYSKAWVGSLWGLAAFVEFPAMYLAGIASDLVGTVVMLAAGGLLIGIVNTGYLLLASYLPALLTIQVVRGFGFGSYTTSAMTFTTDFGAQHTRGRTSGLFYTVASTGQLLGSYLGGTLADWQGFGFMYGFCAATALCAGICFLLLRRHHR